MGKGKDKWPILLIRFAQALTVGLAYYFVVGIPGLPLFLRRHFRCICFLLT